MTLATRSAPRRLAIASLYAVLYAALSGCVVGYGPCLFLQPFKNEFSGRVHFKQYPNADGVDDVPVLALDNTAYIYAPAQSLHCLAANDVQLAGISEFPRDVVENTHVRVTGKLFQATAGREHTQFLLDVNSIFPITNTPANPDNSEVGNHEK